jgi:hypothetical protein
MVSEAAVLQMSKSLNLTIVLAVGCILVGCAGTICGAETLGCCRSRELAPWPHVQCPHDRLHADRKRRTPKRARQIFIRPSCHERRLRLVALPSWHPVPNRRHERRIYYRRLWSGVDRHQHDRSLQADQAGDETLGRAQCRHRNSAVGLREAKSQSAGSTCKTSDTSTHDRGASKKERRSGLEGS